VFEYYAVHLQDWAQANGVRLPIVPSYCEQSYHMFYMLLPLLEQRQKLIAHLKRADILSVFHYLPLHLSPMGRKWEYQQGDCPVTEDISDRLLRLPFYNELSPEQQQEVCAAIFEVAESW
jgi:dTDP-4-amino-4,6-dideoxygalactose transaminase